MMITTLRPFRGDEGFVTARTTMDVSEKRAKALVEKGLAVYAVGAQTVAIRNKALPASRSGPGKPVARAQGAAKEAGGEEATVQTAEDPTPSPQRGSRTGAKKSRSSSRRVRRQKE